MKHLFIMVLAALTLASCTPKTAQNTNKTINLEDMTKDQKASYSYGVLVADNLKRNNMQEIDATVVAQAIKDVMGEGEPLISINEAQTEWQQYAAGIQAKQQQADLASAQDNKDAGAAFLAENKNKEGVVQLESGMQYKILKEGSGKKPGPTDRVTTHYHGTLIDGTVFDSSVERGEPATFGVNQVIAGWTEALQLMPEGSKWQLYIPSELAYGDRGAGAKIKPGSTLIFDVELLKVN